MLLRNPIFLAAALTAACTVSTNSGPTDPPAEPQVTTTSAEPKPVAADDGTPAAPPADEGCQSDADCDGGVCEGEGCGPDQPGTCMPTDRMCTRDAALYCGCDGAEFRSSGSCPGQRYANRGACEGAAEPEGKPGGV